MAEIRNSFYMTLPSNVRDIFGTNTIGNYQTKLAQPYRFDESWEVGLVEILFTKSWYNIRENQYIGIEDTKGNAVSNVEFMLPAGGYDNQIDVISKINALLQRATEEYIKHIYTHSDYRPPNLEYDVHSRRVTLRAGRAGHKEPLFAVLDVELREMLGINFESNLQYDINDQKDNADVSIARRFIKGDIEAFHTYDISAGIHSLFVYCNIVTPSPVGDTYAKLLRVVQVPNVSFGDRVQKIFDQPHYYKISTNEFQVIEVDIKDDNGQTIKFKDGRVTIKLHFRQNGL